MDTVWRYEPALDTGTVTVHIRRLSSKLEIDPAKPQHLETLDGSRIAPPASPYARRH